MIRFPILFVFISSCVAATHPVSKTPSLVEALFGETPPMSCPENGLLKLEGVIDESSSVAFIAQLHLCQGRRVVVEINSPGGSVFAALEIQKVIERHGKPVTCVVDGLAASAAFVTLQSCTTRYATDRSILMAHHASTTVQGQEQDMKNGLARLRAVDLAMAARCAHRMGLTSAEFESHVSDGREWWLSQEDALATHALDGAAVSVDEVVRLAAK